MPPAPCLQAAQIEMHLRSTRDQTVRIGALDESFRFEEGECVRTEISRTNLRHAEEVDVPVSVVGDDLEEKVGTVDIAVDSMLGVGVTGAVWVVDGGWSLPEPMVDAEGKVFRRRERDA